jgi:hypothetical protein
MICLPCEKRAFSESTCDPMTKTVLNVPMYYLEAVKFTRGWRNVEFTYTVAKKIKAQVLNPPPSLPPKLGMFFPPSHVFLGRNHLAITSHQPDNILVSTTRVLNLSQKFINDSDNCNELRNNYSVGTQRVTDEPKWVSTTASGLNSLTQLQVTSTNTRCELRR